MEVSTVQALDVRRIGRYVCKKQKRQGFVQCNVADAMGKFPRKYLAACGDRVHKK